jgi:DNA polymerase-3 subunit gamma/tau
MLLLKLQGEALLDLAVEAIETLKAQAERMSTPELLRAVKQFNQAETELRGGWQPQLPLELALVGLVVEGGGESVAPVAATPRPAPAVPRRERPKAAPSKVETPVQAQPEPSKVETPVRAKPESKAPAQDASGLTLEVVQGRWRQVLVEVKARDLGVQALLNSARPGSVGGDVVTLDVAHEFARNKLNQQRTKRLVEDVLSQVCGQRCQVAYRIAASASGVEHERANVQDEWSDDPLVQAAKNLGAEVRHIKD